MSQREIPGGAPVAGPVPGAATWEADPGSTESPTAGNVRRSGGGSRIESRIKSKSKSKRRIKSKSEINGEGGGVTGEHAFLVCSKLGRV